MFTSDSSHCHPADSILDTNIILSHAICPSLCSSNKEDLERDRAHVSITSSFVPGAKPLNCMIAATKFKPTKINFGGLFGLSTKINTHENYPLYGIYPRFIQYFLGGIIRQQLLFSCIQVCHNQSIGNMSLSNYSKLSKTSHDLNNLKRMMNFVSTYCPQ